VPSIKDLKKRIGSVKNTQQTTKAMKLVSAAKLRRAQDAILSQRPYAREIAATMAMVASGDDVPAQGAAKTTLALVISSDRGLCGGYNSGVVKAGQKFAASEAAAGRKVIWAYVGKKAGELLRVRVEGEILLREEFGKRVSVKRAAQVAQTLYESFNAGKCDRVVIIFNQFINVMSQVVETQQVLPILKENAEEHRPSDNVKFVPNRTELYQALRGQYLVSQVFRGFLDAQASEHGARMTAMENATKNAGDMIRKLTLQFNKQRQAAITKELLEIISGSESQKTA
jgi:F-type H+-transporting ATPase subunit gamma